MNEAQLLHLLRDCYEPVSRRNIVAANLIRSITLTADDTAPGALVSGVSQRSHAHITLLAPGSDDGVNAQLVAQIENRLLGVEEISRVSVILLPPLFPIL